MSITRRHFLKLSVAGLAMTKLESISQSLAASNIEIGGPPSHSFIVGEYLKFRSYKDSDGRVFSTKEYIENAWFEELGLQPINLVYASKYIDVKGLDAEVNEDKLRSIARDANPALPVSLDAEEWDKLRFNPDALAPNGKSILKNLIDVVRTFKQTNPATKVGLYGEVPQNTYGFSDATTSIYDKLNLKYLNLAAEVDFYSPSLYNYEHYDGSEIADRRWSLAAEYAIHSCKLMDNINHTNKSILAYLSPGWMSADKKQSYLNYEQMMFRLETLKRLGASGCILWLSSEAKESNSNENLVLDPNTGWLKAAVEFAHKNN
jgi:hypothetical protein